jgi:hypothetical protein
MPPIARYIPYIKEAETLANFICPKTENIVSIKAILRGQAGITPTRDNRANGFLSLCIPNFEIENGAFYESPAEIEVDFSLFRAQGN